jgi:uncharacterized protein
MRLFLDTNILFAAAISPLGNARALFRLAKIGRCQLLTCGYVIGEARRNLARKNPDGLAALEGLLEHVEIAPEPPAGLVAAARAHLPEKDAPILAAAIASRADYLVTGDVRHFGPYFGKTIADAKIIRLVEALALVLSDTPE